MKWSQSTFCAVLLAAALSALPAWGGQAASTGDTGASGNSQTVASGTETAQAAQAQPTPLVNNTTGEVRTATGEPVPGATVRITNTETHKVWLSWTDEKGDFAFPQLPQGYYRVEVTQLGFSPSSIDVKLPVMPPGPIPIQLRVQTLAELNGAPESAANNSSRNANASQAKTGPQQAARVANPAEANQRRPGGGGQFGGLRGRAQMPAGLRNAMQAGLATNPFQQTDLTGTGAAGQENENPNGAAGSNEPTASLSNENASSASANSFLLQGTVGQETSMTGFGGPGGFGPGGFGGGPGGLAPDAPSGSAGNPFGAGGGPGGAGGRGGMRGRGRFYVRGRGRGAPPGGLFAGRARLMRQAINRVRFGFYDQYSNSALSAKPYSITGENFPKVANYDERFGGNMGGPLKIPHIYDGSDRTYFFLNYQHQLVKNAVNSFSLVPTSDERSGNFCSVGNGFTLYDPSSNFSGARTVLNDGCHIPTGSIDTASNGLLQYIPLPNIAAISGPRGQTYNYLLQATTPQNTDSVNFHVLHTINSKLNLNGGYNLSSSRHDTLGNFASIAGHQSTLSQSVNIGLNHNWTPDMVEATSLNWSRSRAQILSDNSYVNNIAGGLGIQDVSTDPINYGIPEIQFSSLGSLNDPVPSLVRNQTLRFMEGWTYTHGDHTIQFGAEIRRIQFNTDSDPDPRGRFMFTGQMTSQLDATGRPIETAATEPYYEFADFLLGLPYNTQIRTGDASTYFRNWEFVGYGQDDWHVNKKFTLLFGLRYSAVTPPTELFDHISNLDLNSTANQVVVVTPGETGLFGGTYPQALIHGDYTNFAPRFGFAWAPGIHPRTIVRGGYSIFYNDSVYDTLAQDYLAYQPPFAVSQNLYTAAAQVLTLQNGFPTAGATNFCTPTLPTNCTVPNTSGVSPFYKDGYAQIWMLSAETYLSQDWILNLTYTGTKGTDLDLLRAPNRAPLGTNPFSTQANLTIPYASAFDYDQSGADSLYNALQVRLMHRFTHGIMGMVMYTFAKSLDNASSIGGGSPIVVQQDGNYGAEWGLSSFDMRHQIRLMSMWELPFGERHNLASHGWQSKVFGDWRLMNMVGWHTGTPFTAYLGGGAANNSGTGANFSERAEQIGDPNAGLCGGSALNFFNTGAFVVPTAGTYGNERRGAIEGPCSFSWNASLAKSFRFGPRERQRSITARWEVQNLTNSPSFTGISTTLGSPLFGQINAAGSMRSMDFMLRFNF
ncbi:MAG TPA: TonB-dependent receptor [Candidatus Acidoferrales bacterium]|nr:TonB-dependent receptor [Candidatus Acidoferrales bacterium]